MSMSIKEMKAAITKAGLSHVGVTEKEELRKLAALALQQAPPPEPAVSSAMSQFLADIRAGDMHAVKAAIRCSASEMRSFGKDELLANGLVEACLSHVADRSVAHRPPATADLRLLSQGGQTPMPILALNVLVNATSQVRVAGWDARVLALQLRPLLRLMALDVRLVWGEPRIWDGCAVMALALFRHVILHGQAAAKEALWSGTGCGDACLRLAACALDDEGMMMAGMTVGMRTPLEMGATVLMEWCDVGLSGSTVGPDAAGRATLATVAAIPCGPGLTSTFAMELPRLVCVAAADGASGVLDSLAYAHACLLKEGGAATQPLREAAAVKRIVSATEGSAVPAARDSAVATHLCAMLGQSLGGSAGTPSDVEAAAVVSAGAIEAALRLLALHPRGASELEQYATTLLGVARQCALQKRTGAALRAPARVEGIRAALAALRSKARGAAGAARTGAVEQAIEQAEGLLQLCQTVAQATAHTVTNERGERRATSAAARGEQGSIRLGVDVTRCASCHVECDRSKKCERCRTVYCSRECQVAHWPEHRAECKIKRQIRNSGNAPEGSAAARRNAADDFDADAFSRAANELFYARKEGVIQSAALQRVDLFDCVVCIDMSSERHRVRPVPVAQLSRFLDTAVGFDYHQGGGENWKHLQVVLARNRRNGALTALAYAHTGRTPPEASHECILKTFPANPGITWKQMYDGLLAEPLFQELLADSDTHEEEIEALALGASAFSTL